MRTLFWFVTVLLITMSPVVRAQSQDDAFFSLQVSNTTPYIGENITYTWTLYYAGDAPLTDAAFVPPAFNGFGQQHLRPPSATNEFQNERLYTVTTGQVILTPLRAGTQTIESYRIIIPETPFSDAQTIESDPVEVTVQPLPQPVPEQFSGGIGAFTYSADTDNAAGSVTAGSPFTITATASGTGSLPNITLPAPTFDSNMLQLVNTNTSFEASGINPGQYITRWTFIAHQPGTTTINVPPLVTFDPQNEAYRTITISPISLQINGSVGTESAITSDTLQADALLPIRLDSASWQPDRTYWLLWLVPAAIVVFTALFTRGRRLSRPALSARRSRRQSTSARHTIEHIRAQLKKPPTDAFNNISAILDAYLYRRFNLETSTDLMTEQFINDAITQEAHRILTSARHGKYAPVAQVDVQKLIRSSVALIKRIEAEI